MERQAQSATPSDPTMSRREVLQAGLVGSAALAGAHLAAPQQGHAAAAPKPGGIARLRGYDPPHFDPHLNVSYRLHTLLSFTHSRLLRHKFGPEVTPGSFLVEGDVAESWENPNPTTYIFHLHQGVHFHDKPPVNGREMTADDVTFSFDRFINTKGNANRYMLSSVDRIEALDKYTVKFTLKEPYAWFLNILSSPTGTWIVAKEAVETFGDLKKQEACIGTGPFVLENWDPNKQSILKRHPGFYMSGRPYLDEANWIVFEDLSTRTAAYRTGKVDFGPEWITAVRQEDLASFKRTNPNYTYMEYRSDVFGYLYMRTDKPPFNDVRVRRAISMAWDRKGVMAAINEGRGMLTAHVPAFLVDWSLPVDQLGDAARYLEYNPKEARKLLAQAGYPHGFETPLHTTFGYGSVWKDHVQMVAEFLNQIGIKTTIEPKDYGAYISSTFFGKYDMLAMGLQTPYTEPDNYLYGPYYPGHFKNQSHVNDPKLAQMLDEQRRTLDTEARRQQLFAIQRYLAEQMYYVPAYTGFTVGSWQPHVKNYMVNNSYDFGSRLINTWLDKA
jgi:peptide/nickel transport system substrate-binding protein